MDNLQNIRRELRARRNQLVPPALHQASHSIIGRLIQTSAYRASTSIASYWPVNNEVDTQALSDHASTHGKKIYLPVLSGLNKQFLHFARYRAGQPLQTNQFGIPEPVCGPADLLEPIQLDLVVTPLLGFDHRLNRIGMGGGYYDRTFHYLLNKKYWIKPVLIGIAFECQKLEQIQPNSWDVKLSAVITEQHHYR